MNAAAREPVPDEVVAVTLHAPGVVVAGVRAVRAVVVDTDTLVAERPHTLTEVAPATKRVPVSVIDVPPLRGPDEGDTDVIVGTLGFDAFRIVTTNPVAVAELTAIAMPLAVSLNVSPTAKIAPPSPVLPLLSTSITLEGMPSDVRTSWMMTPCPGSFAS